MSYKANDALVDAIRDAFNWVDKARYGCPDESGMYLCAFNDNTIETCHYTGKDDDFWHDRQTSGHYKITHWCVIEDEWHPARKTKCQNCGEVEVVVVNTYHEGDTVWSECECSNCKAYTQRAALDPDYDPSPEDQEDVTRIGGWG